MNATFDSRRRRSTLLFLMFIVASTATARVTRSQSPSLATPATPATAPASFADIPEFQGFELARTEKELTRFIAERGLKYVCTCPGRAPKYFHIYRRDGQNIRVTYKGGDFFVGTEGVFSGVERMPVCAYYADRLYNGLAKAADDLKLTLHPTTQPWIEGEKPSLKADVQNTGPDDWALLINGIDGWQIQVDGQWYTHVTSTTGRAILIAPGETFKGITVPADWIRATLNWYPAPINPRFADPGKPLAIRPGRHTIRVGVFPMMDSGPGEFRTELRKDGTPIRVAVPTQPMPLKSKPVVSNPIEINVLPAAPDKL